MAHDPAAYARSVGLDPATLPRHVAVIMDGNGRWARAQGKERVEGHARGDPLQQLIEGHWSSSMLLPKRRRPAPFRTGLYFIS